MVKKVSLEKSRLENAANLRFCNPIAKYLFLCLKLVTGMADTLLFLLQKHKLRKTDIRKKVLQVFLDAGTTAVGNAELEQALPSADRITLYRTLRSFEERGLIHQAIDGSGIAKYALCHANCNVHAHHDNHAHFRCYDCGQTICLEASLESSIQVPKGFIVNQTHLVLEGQCASCTKKN